MVVHATSHYDEEHDKTYYTADKSFDEVASFIENGGIPILIGSDNYKIVQCDYISRDASGNIEDIGFARVVFNTYTNKIVFESYLYFVDNPIPNYIEYFETSYDGSSGGGGEDPSNPIS